MKVYLNTVGGYCSVMKKVDGDKDKVTTNPKKRKNQIQVNKKKYHSLHYLYFNPLPRPISNEEDMKWYFWVDEGFDKS